jgi:aldehyde:ferredoxin oxidoreductase
MYTPRYVIINLSNNQIKPYPIPKTYINNYIGGKALAARLLFDLMPARVDPFSEENSLIINTGPLVGSGAPSTSRFNITTKNVLTGGIATSNSGGDFGIKLRKSGFDGLIIKGKAKAPVYIKITDGNIKILSARHLWEKDTEVTQRELPKHYGKIVIGPAGENLVKFASIVSGERTSGRTGVGAVMGSKMLKAVIAHGKEKIPIHTEIKFKAYIKNWIAKLKNHKVTGHLLPKYGTLALANNAFAANLYPVNNFSVAGHYGNYKRLTGQYFTEKFLTRNFGCPSCPIKCGRRTQINNKDIKGPEFETTGLLGVNLGNYDFTKINSWNYLADRLGMDTISLGNVLGWACESRERGIVDFGIGFNHLENVESLIQDIACRRGRGNELANGVRWLSEKYGGKDYAMHIKGLEQPAFDTRNSLGMGLGMATANRGGCHLNGGYIVFIEGLAPFRLNPKAIYAKTGIIYLFQNLFEAISSSGICIFTLFQIFPNYFFMIKPTHPFQKIVSLTLSLLGRLAKAISEHLDILNFNLPIIPYLKALKYVTGMQITLGKFLKWGERAYNIERLFNLREGMEGNDDTLSPRALKAYKNINKNLFKSMLSLYYKIRGWDGSGKPTQVKLKKLGIAIKTEGFLHR